MAWAHFSHRDRAANDMETQITELRLLQSMQWEELARQQEKELARQQERIRKAEKRCAAAEEELARQQEKPDAKAKGKANAKGQGQGRCSFFSAKAEGKANAEEVELEPAEAEGQVTWCERSH